MKKIFKHKLAAAVVVLSVGFVGLIVWTANKTDLSGKGAAGAALNPVQKVLYSITNSVKGSIDFFLNFEDVKKENEELKNQNAELESKITDYGDLQRENQNLRQAFDFKEKNDEYDYLGCDIIGYAGGGYVFDGSYIINKGTKDNVHKNMVVTARRGLLVGQVVEAHDTWSVVKTITTLDVAVAVKKAENAEPKSTDAEDGSDNQYTADTDTENMTEAEKAAAQKKAEENKKAAENKKDDENPKGTEEKGYLTGCGERGSENLSKIYNLPIESTDIAEGDEIVTSGIGGVYPKGLRVGKIKSVSDDNIKVMKVAIVEPYADFNQLEELFIVVPKNLTVNENGEISGELNYES